MVRAFQGEANSIIYTWDGDGAYSVQGSFVLELFNFQGQARVDSNMVQLVSGYVESASHESFGFVGSYNRTILKVQDGSLTIEFTGMRGSFIAAGVDVQVDGRISSPRGTSPPPFGLDDEITWWYDGNAHLMNVQAAGPRQASATASLDRNGVFLADGEPVAFQAKPAQAVAAVGGSIGLVALIRYAAPILTPLLTRLPPEKALENANRRTLYECIKDHPGATFRELLRRTEIPAGTARHHLTVLARSRVIVEHGHRSTRRFFENHGRFDQTWSALVLLREKELAKVHDWFARHPGAMQKDLLQHAEDRWGWSRSTTQHRLARLVDGGLIDVRQAGRSKFYEAKSPEDAQAAPPRAAWS